MFLVANLVYFHLLFTEFKNLDPLAENSQICQGRWGLQRAILVYLELFDDQMMINLHENVLS